MNILVINSGSSSIKYQLFSMPDAHVICSGMVERIGLENGLIKYNYQTNTYEEVINIPDHKKGLEKVVNLLLDKDIGVIKSTNDIAAVGHRVVHGGNRFTKTTKVTPEVKNEIKELFSLAPLHNPANLEGILVCENLFKKATQIAVFDTAFHQTIPVKAHKYAIPNHLYNNEHIRLYGFHGTSHKYVAKQAITHLNLKTSKIISLHLGNGCSVTAIQNGKSIDHSLGFGPVTGLVMGTRSGDIDHELIFYLVNKLNYSFNDVQTMLQKQSGMLGLTGYSDLRDIETNAKNGDKECQLALEINAYRIKKYIGSYIAVMNGVDALIFTAGIGENSKLIRQLVCKDLDVFGITLDDDRNNTRSEELIEIQKEGSKVKILVIPTNEELEIAKQSYNLL